jgi:hypothetical protein
MERIHNPYVTLQASMNKLHFLSSFNVFMDDVGLFQLEACLIHLNGCSYSGIVVTQS